MEETSNKGLPTISISPPKHPQFALFWVLDQPDVLQSTSVCKCPPAPKPATLTSQEKFAIREKGIPFTTTKVTTKSYQGYYWTPKVATTKKVQNSIIRSGRMAPS